MELHANGREIIYVERGYVKLWRKTIDSGLLEHPTAWQLFGWVLLNATHKTRKTIVSGQIIELQPGEVVFTRRVTSVKLGMSEQQIRTALGVLVSNQVVTSKTTRRCTIISLTNWDRYQQDAPTEQPTDQPRIQPTINPRPTHEQECKNNIINTPNGVFVPSDAGDVEQCSLLDAGTGKKTKCNQTPDCPHERIVQIYHETLPMLPKVKNWDENRQGYLRTRWRERMSAGKYSSLQEGLDYWKRLFVHIRENCPWLTGQIEGRNGRAFMADLEWIVRPTNFNKIIEGRYDRQREVA